MGKIVNVGHHCPCVEDPKIATTNGVIFACDFFDRTVDTKAFFEQFYELLGKPFVQITEYAIERNAIYVDVIRIIFLWEMHELQFVASLALCDCALVRGVLHSVNLTKHGKGKT